MNKKEFEKVEKDYLLERKRFEEIKKGSLVWEVIGRGGDIDYHPAIVKKINVDECYVEVLDVSVTPPKDKKYHSFSTEKELIEYNGFTEKRMKEIGKKIYEEHGKTLEKIFEKK